MDTLEGIGVTLAVGSAVTAVAVSLFGVAVRRRSTLIAPRATARPRNVIYNPHAATASSSSSPKKEDCPQQYRGTCSSCTGWIPWTLRLSYEVMLKGVPGTGTRQGGHSGLLLKVNLDGIVMLRFHSLCRRLAMIACLLFNIILLPLYLTAQCHRWEDVVDPEGSCSSGSGYNLTSYERLTILNIPNVRMSSLTETQEYTFLARLYITSFVFLALVGWILHHLDRTWVLLLALRRVYYLEHDIWQERQREFKQTLLYNDDDDLEASSSSPPPDNDKINSNQYLSERDPWIPHPEQRETVPNIGLYSVLVGNLPSIPETLVHNHHSNHHHHNRLIILSQQQQQQQHPQPPPQPQPPQDAAAAEERKLGIIQRTNMDWQIEMATQIFDLCVPNQPGFSSSVAAVTILPGANDMTTAWRRWYTAAARMRRLTLIRAEIQKRRNYEIEVSSDDETKKHAVLAESKWVEIPERRNEDLEDDDHDDEYFSTQGVEKKPQSSSGEGQEHESETDSSPRPIYRDLSQRKSYFRQVFGSAVHESLEREIAQRFTLGPEQAAVYSREVAQSAAPCCPFGCRQDRIRTARIDELVEMEKEAAEELHAANEALNDIRRKVTVLAEEYQNMNAEKLPLSFDDQHVPSDLDLEAQLYSRITSNQETALHQPHTDPPPVNLSTAEILPMSRDFESNLWLSVQAIIHESKVVNNNQVRSSKALEAEASEQSRVDLGVWHMPSVDGSKHKALRILRSIREWTKIRSAVAYGTIVRDSTYAVVTFTSRQAAVAARMCIADGRGLERWQTIKDIPVPPLADAAACDILACRNCFRPVTISINPRQKSVRKWIAIILLGFIYVFYSVPLTFAASLATAGFLEAIAPNIANWVNSMGINISGIISSMLYSLFFSLCPTMFKTIANFGSGSTSVARAEHQALQYYWYFMVLTAFSSTLLASMVVDAWNNDLSFGSSFIEVIETISTTLASTISVAWLNWIIWRCTVSLPLNYLLQMNSFIFSFLRMKCCARLMQGGGPGPPVPFRMFVDSGVVFMCILGLAPSVPIVSIAGLAYFVMVEPILRRNLIFVYRPNFDEGGSRWTCLSDMIIVSIIVGVILLTSQMVLKGALGPAIIAGLTIVPPLVYKSHLNYKYKLAFRDAALLQTSLLDGWDTAEPSSMARREEFRRWLVDAHKAAYVPVCLFGLESVGCLTAEPAVVLPLDQDLDGNPEEDDPENAMIPDDDDNDDDRRPPSEQSMVVAPLLLLSSPKSPMTRTQVGATFRRSVSALSIVRKASNAAVSSSTTPGMEALRLRDGGGPFTMSAPPAYKLE